MRNYAMDDYDFIREKLEELKQTQNNSDIEQLRQKYLTGGYTKIDDADGEVISAHYNCQWVGYEERHICQMNAGAGHGSTGFECLHANACVAWSKKKRS